jgi:hypothetical protein
MLNSLSGEFQVVKYEMRESSTAERLDRIEQDCSLKIATTAWLNRNFTYQGINQIPDNIATGNIFTEMNRHRRDDTFRGNLKILIVL